MDKEVIMPCLVRVLVEAVYCIFWYLLHYWYIYLRCVCHPPCCFACLSLVPVSHEHLVHAPP